MKWSETTASDCRYGDIAERIFGDCEIIWEHSRVDYQGFASVLAAKSDGSFIHYEWTYGSCSGCDEWEACNLDDDAIEQEMRSAMAVLKDRDTLQRYLKLESEFQNIYVPTANLPTNGSIPGILRVLGGDFLNDFEAMREAAFEWLKKH